MSARTCRARADAGSALRDGRRTRGARPAQDAHEGILRVLHGFRRAAEREHLSGLPRAARRAAGAQRARRRAGDPRRARARLHGPSRLDLRAQELLLSRSARRAIRSRSSTSRSRRTGASTIGARTRRARRSRSASRACTWRRTPASRSTIAFPASTAIDLNRAGVPLDRDRQRAGHALVGAGRRVSARRSSRSSSTST